MGRDLPLNAADDVDLNVDGDVDFDGDGDLNLVGTVDDEGCCLSCLGVGFLQPSGGNPDVTHVPGLKPHLCSWLHSSDGSCCSSVFVKGGDQVHVAVAVKVHVNVNVDVDVER